MSNELSLRDLQVLRQRLEKPLQWWAKVAMLALTLGETRWRPYGPDGGSNHWAILRSAGFIVDSKRGGQDGYVICIPDYFMEFFQR